MVKIFVNVAGKRWGFRFVSMPDKNDKTCKGYCESPDKKNKEIVIKEDMPPKEELDTTLHELLHAADWSKDEEWVEQVGTDIAKILWRLGWRKPEQ
tara:strand:+ start:833 stop:1120 length:288 start_codon:yes stop_codon:yes gene_type:complete